MAFTSSLYSQVIDGDGGEEEIPDVPDSGLEQGILPKLLATFVERRRQVKGLMKNADPKSAEYAQVLRSGQRASM